MIILGVGFLSDASVCILRDGTIVAAISEERLNRVKLWHGVPERAIERVLDLSGLTLDEVDCVATHGRSPDGPRRDRYDSMAAEISAAPLSPETAESQLRALWTRFEHETYVIDERTPSLLSTLAALGRPMKVYGHHECHAACAYYGSGWTEGVAVTADGWGEDASHSVSVGSGSQLRCHVRSSPIDSLGYFYGSVTKALGFVPQRHEGKVLGLAAHCRNPRSYPLLRSMVDCDSSRGGFIGHMERGLFIPRFDNSSLVAALEGFPREDVAAGVQRVLEEVICEHVTSLGASAARVAVAGGIFANVRLNQKIAELGNVNELFVFPNMGDGGLAVGAAWLAHVESSGRRPEPWTTCYLGDEPSEEEVLESLRDSGLSWRRSSSVHDEIADYLAAGKVVARCTGRMEFGPRALGHRSILYQATDRSSNHWLNARLGRSEFMPFAPVSLAEDAEQLYIEIDRYGAGPKYMTITCQCTPLMKRRYEAAVHVDGSARPQLVSPGDHADLFRVVSAYKAKTGELALINTSFNMHEEPIVCGAADAVRAFVASGLDVLALGDFLAER